MTPQQLKAGINTGLYFDSLDDQRKWHDSQDQMWASMQARSDQIKDSPESALEWVMGGPSRGRRTSYVYRR